MKCGRILGTGSRLCLLMLRGFALLTIGSGLTAVSAAQSGWYWQNPLPQGHPLRAVAVLDGKTVIAVGGFGTILRTTDGGASWTLQSSGTTNTLLGVSFTDADTGTAVGAGGTILRTTDGGASWTLQSSGTLNHLRGVSFADANTGTVVGAGGTILRTTTGGEPALR